MNPNIIKAGKCELPLEYFRPTDVCGEYEMTPTFIYNAQKDAVEYFKNLVYMLDIDCEYHSESDGQVIDFHLTQENKDKYREQYELFEQWWVTYKEEHLDEFTERIRIDTGDEIKAFRRDFKPDIRHHFSLSEALSGYLYAKELLGEVKEDESIPRVSDLISKRDFLDDHRAIREQKKEELGIPSDDVLNVYRDTVSMRMKQDRTIKKSFTPDESVYFDFLNEFANEFVKQYQ